MNRFLRVVLVVSTLLVLSLGVWRWLSPPSPAVDLGVWRLLAIQSDDWGFEGWFPDAAAADSLAHLAASLPPRLRPYGSSSLESAAEVESLSALFSQLEDSDGLPLILQANTVVGAVELPRPGIEASPPREGELRWPGLPLRLRDGGSGPGRYHRPGLGQAVDVAIARGVWRPELHALSHFHLERYWAAWLGADEIAVEAHGHGVVAWSGWRTQHELADGDAQRSQAVASTAVEMFRRRFGRSPRSVIGPDFVWGPDDERAWKSLGIQVVQAKREQVDPAVNPTSFWGRLRKLISRWQDRRRGEFVYLERHAELEPYGDPDPACSQGAEEAARKILASWDRGEAAVLSIHRVQFSNLDPSVGSVGREQLRHMVGLLRAQGDLRFCVDAELASLWRSGVSVLRRGPWYIVRNYTDGPVSLSVEEGAPARSFEPGTHRLEAGLSRP